MFSISTFFDNMPKSLLREVHAKAFGKKGLLNNTLIVKESIQYFSEKKRFDHFLSVLESWQVNCLYLIYRSESRGLTYNELRLTVPVNKARELQNFLLNACREYVIWQGKSTSHVLLYKGFSDFVDSFNSSGIEVFSSTETIGSLEYDYLFDWHICKILGMAAKGLLKVNLTEGLHRRSLALCENAITYSKALSSKATHDETLFILHFLSQNDWLGREDSLLKPTPKAHQFLKKNGFRLRQEIIAWWIKNRFRGNEDHFKRLLENLINPINIVDAAYLFWVIDPSYRILERTKTLTWDYLPKPLRELWFLGFVDFKCVKDKIHAVSLSKIGRAYLGNEVTPLVSGEVSSLANFELIVGAKNSPRLLFLVAVLATSQNDEPHLKSVFEKEAYLEGLKSGLTEEDVEEFIHWIKPPKNVHDSLLDWGSCFFGAKISTARLLKIENKKILEELMHFSHFMELIKEAIPGYGFILDPSKESDALKLLSHYGLLPNTNQVQTTIEPFKNANWEKEFVLPWPANLDPDYELKESLDKESFISSIEATKYGTLYRKLELMDLIKVMRYAKSTNTMLAAQVKNPDEKHATIKEIFFYAQTLHFSKSPYAAKVQLKDSEDILVLDLNHIQEIKLVYQGMDV
jgi:hypothetical protein